MKLRKTVVPGGACGYVWNTSADVVDVPDEIGLDLVSIPDAGFVEVLPGESPEPDPACAGDPAEVTEAPVRRGRKPRATNDPATVQE